MRWILKAFLCLFSVTACIYLYIDKLNHQTEIRLKIPQLKKKLKEIKEGNNRLRYEIDYFESPLHLMELYRKSEYSHLKHPFQNEVLVIEER